MIDSSNKTKIVAYIAVGLLLVVVVLSGMLLSSDSSDRQNAEITVMPPDTTNQPAAPGKSGLAAADANGDGIVYQSGMHPWIVQDEPGTCPVCGMDLMPVRVDGMEEGTVRIDPVTIQNMGVRTAPVIVTSLDRTVRTTGRFVMDEQGRHTVSLKVSGWAERLYADFEGAILHKGQKLLELYSPELVSTQEEYLLALRNVQRLGDGPAAADAQRLLDASRRRLAYWDLTEDQIRNLEETGQPQHTLTFYARASGEVMNKRVVEGQRIEAGQPLMDLADISKIWLMVDVFEQDLAWVEVGTRASIELPYEPGTTFTGRVDHFYHMLDAEARTAKARIVLPGGHRSPLKPGMYATVTLLGGATEALPVVPSEAIIRTGEREVVVVSIGEGRFKPIPVRVGMESGGRSQILEGLNGDEIVVTSAQFLIDSEARLASAISAMMGHDPSSMSDEEMQDM
jgi:multidrug efflux pump subunit AcrA (membrane-fusion protein)